VALRGYVFGALGVAAFAAIAGIGYAVLVYPEHKARATVDRAIATLPPGWTGRYGGLSYSLLKQQLVLTDVTLARDATRVTASQVSLTGAEGEPGGQFQFHEASMVGVTLHDGAGDTTVRSVDAIEFGGDLSGITQTIAKAEPAEAVLALPHLLRAKRVAISDIKETQGPDTSSIARLVIDDLGHGVIGRLAVEDLRSSAQGSTVAVAKSTLGGTDVEALQAVFDPASYASGQKSRSDSRQLLRSVDMTSVDIGGPTTQLHLDALQLSAFRGRPFALAPIAANASDGRFAADVASALSLDNLALRGMRISNTTTGGVVVLRTFELNGYFGGKLASAKLGGLELTTQQPQPLKAALSAFELRGTDLSRWLKLIVETGPAAAMTHSNGAIELPYATAKDLQIGAANSVSPIRLDSFSSEATYEDGQATNSKGSIKGLEIPLDGLKMPPQQTAEFRGMQISRLVINVEAASRWQPAEKRLLIDGFNFGLDGLGALDLTASVKGVDPDRFTPETMADALQGLSFERLELHYHDASLVDRIIAMNASQASLRPDQFRANFIQQQEASAAQMQQDAPEAAQALRQVIEFLRHPKTLVLTCAPAQPVTIAAIQAAQPAQLPKIIGLRVVAQ
jgi:hypothetical protein